MIFNLYELLFMEYKQYDKVQEKCEDIIKTTNAEIIESKTERSYNW